MVEDVGESEHFKTALEMIDKMENYRLVLKRAFITKKGYSLLNGKIYADRYMIGGTQRIW